MKLKISSNLLPFFLILPSLLIMLTLYVYPFSLSILKSFISENGEITLKYYQEAIDSYFHDIIFSLEICLLSTFITTILSVLLAIYLRLSESILKRFF